MRAQILENEQVFTIVSAYDKKLVGLIHKIKGRKWHPENKTWTIPISQRQKVEELYYEIEMDRMLSMPPQVGPIPPMPKLQEKIDLLRAPYPFQDEGIAYCLQQHEHVIIGDQPGLGKTTQAIGAVVARNRFPCLVICPNTLKSNWKTEWMTVAGKKALVLDDKNRNTWHLFHHPHKLVDVFIVNYESLQKYFVSHIKKNEKGGFMVKDVVFNEHADIFQSIIVDESHKCKNMQVQWTKFTMGICLRKKAVYAVSGTPLVNSTKDLAAQLFITGRIHEFGGLKFFTKRYVDTNEYLAELQYKLRTTCFFQRKKKDVLKDLPDKVRQIMLCDITNWPEYKVALADLERYLREWKNKTDEQVRKSMRGEIMVQMTMCRNIAARGKMNEVFEYIDQITGAGEKVGIFLNQHQIKHILQAKYPNAVAVTGEEDIDQRAAAVQRFQNDPRCKLILLSIKAAGVGITLTAASRVGLVEFPWHPADGDQCEDRFHRIGQKDSVQATYFLGKGTIDERMYEIMEEKRALGGEVTGNRDDTMTEMIDKLADSLFTTKREAELTI